MKIRRVIFLLFLALNGFGLLEFLFTQQFVIFGFQFKLFFGWISHLQGTAPALLKNTPWMLSVVFWLAITLCTLHWLLKNLSTRETDSPPKWRIGHSLAVLVLTLCTFATASAAVGVIHHSLWLVREPWIHEPGRNTWRIQSNGRQLVTALRLYAADYGNYPASLEAIPSEILEAEKLAKLVRIEIPRSVVGHWIYLPGVRDDLSGDIPVLVASVPTASGKYHVVLNDTRTQIVDSQALSVLLENWRKHVGASRLPLGLEPKS